MFKACENQQVLRADTERQRRIAEEASRNYEEELVKHAKDVEQIALLKQRIQEFQMEHSRLENQARTAKNSLETARVSWQEQKTLLENQIRETERRLSEMSSQNAILHSQLESLGAQVSRLQRPLLESDNDNVLRVAMATDMRTIEDLREVIKFLRRDKEVLDYEKDAQIQEARRLQQQLEFTTRSLDETRAQLTDLQHHQERGRFISVQEHEELVSKAGQVDLLRASNQTLRDENTRSRDRATFFERRNEELMTQLNPLKGGCLFSF
jgi:nucleoprotein TPR